MSRRAHKPKPKAVALPSLRPSGTNQARKDRRAEKKAAPLPEATPAPIPRAELAGLLPAHLLPKEPVIPTEHPVETVLRTAPPPAPLPTSLPVRAELPPHHPAHGLSTGQWTLLQLTLGAMACAENTWRATKEAQDLLPRLEDLARRILAFDATPGAAPTGLTRQTFDAPHPEVPLDR